VPEETKPRWWKFWGNEPSVEEPPQYTVRVEVEQPDPEPDTVNPVFVVGPDSHLLQGDREFILVFPHRVAAKAMDGWDVEEDEFRGRHDEVFVLMSRKKVKPDAEA
jgi:hypothetical protein